MKQLFVLFALASVLAAQTPFTDFEVSQVHPLALSPSGARLFALNSGAGRLLVFDVSRPLDAKLISEIPVGVGPTSIAARDEDEVWVVDAISDSLSIVSVARGEVIAVLPVGDDPADVVFAGNPLRAFVTLAGEDRIVAIDAASRTPVFSAPVPMKEPRALAVDRVRGRVWALSFRSGNRTTIIPAPLAPPPPTPLDPNLPQAPQQALIVSKDDPQWATHPVNLPDIDAVVFDPTTFQPLALVDRIGTINYDLAIDPLSGFAVVAGFDSRNIEDYEPVVRARYIHNRVMIVDPLGPLDLTVDLDDQLETVNLPDPASRAIALAEPSAIAIDPIGRRIWVVAQGTDRLAEISEAGEVLRRIDLVGGAIQGARGQKRGPRGIVLDAHGDYAFVHERMANRLAIVDLVAGQVVRELDFGLEPLSEHLRRGRGFLYDALLSGNGSASCAGCHIDAEHDLLAWNLGDPSGSMSPVPPQAPRPDFPPNSFPAYDFHPMKGPMVTQTLRGLAGNKPYHWRGDKADVEDFNGAFVSLMGGDLLAPEEITAMADWVRSLSHQPNSNMNPDRSYSASAQAGKTAFETLPAVDFGGGFTLRCMDCHSEPDGSGPVTILPIPTTFIGPSQPTNTPQLRGLHRRGAALITGAPSKVGFGFSHDGGLPDLRFFLEIPAFSLTPTAVKNDLAEFLRCFDTGVAPAVGRRIRLDLASALGVSFQTELQLLESRVAAGDIDLVAIGLEDGRPARFAYDPTTTLYRSSYDGLSRPRSVLESLAAAGRVELVFTALPPGEAPRHAGDFDQNGISDQNDSGLVYGSASFGPTGPLTLRHLSRHERWLGERLVLNGVPPTARVNLAVSLRARQVNIGGGLVVLVDPNQIVTMVPMESQGAGLGVFDLPPATADRYVQAFVVVPGNPPTKLVSNGILLRP